MFTAVSLLLFADFAVSAAKLTRVVAVSLISSCLVSAVMEHSYLVGVASVLVEQALNLALRFLDCGDIDVSDEVLEVVEDVVLCLKREVTVVQEYGGVLGVPMPIAAVSASAPGTGTSTRE